MARDNNSAHFGLGIVLGAVVGGVAAVLLAPEKNRRMVKSGLDKAQKAWRDTDGDPQATLEAVFGDSFAKGGAYFDKAKAMFDKSVADAKVGVADLQEKDFKEIVADIEKKLSKDLPEAGSNWKDQLRLEWEKAKKEKKK